MLFQKALTALFFVLVTGVNFWSETFSDHCGGRKQSPIDITTNALSVLYSNSSCECPFLGYNNRFLHGYLKNTGTISGHQKQWNNVYEAYLTCASSSLSWQYCVQLKGQARWTRDGGIGGWLYGVNVTQLSYLQPS